MFIFFSYSGSSYCDRSQDIHEHLRGDLRQYAFWAILEGKNTMAAMYPPDVLAAIASGNSVVRSAARRPC